MKTKLKVIKAISDILPKQQYQFKGRQKLLGSDAILAGHKEIEKQEIDPEKEYILNMPYSNSVNHYNRLKRAYKRHGRSGIINYCKPYIKKEHFGKFQVQIFTALS